MADKVEQKSNETRLVDTFQKGESVDKNRWQIVSAIYKDNPALLLKIETDEEEKKFKQRFNKAFTGHLADTVGHMVPKHGISRNTGERIELRSDNGDIKWSTWSGSARTIQHLSEVAKLTYLGGDIMDKKGNLKSRYAMTKELKDLRDGDDSGSSSGAGNKPPANESPYQTIVRCTDLATAKLTEITDEEEAKTVAGLLLNLYTQAMNHQGALTAMAKQAVNA